MVSRKTTRSSVRKCIEVRFLPSPGHCSFQDEESLRNYKVVSLKPWQYLLLNGFFNGSYPSWKYFQEDSNTLKHVLFEYYINKLWIFEVSIIPSSKTWVGNTKTWVGSTSKIYSSCTFLDYYSSFSPLQAYFLPNHGNAEVPVLGKLPMLNFHTKASAENKKKKKEGLKRPGAIPEALLTPSLKRNRQQSSCPRGVFQSKPNCDLRGRSSVVLKIRSPSRSASKCSHL
jgi:hypothetical protein